MPEKRLVKAADGLMVAPVKCSKCHKSKAPCPCGYRLRQCVGCCPGEPPGDVARHSSALSLWNAAKGQRAANRAATAQLRKLQRR